MINGISSNDPLSLGAASGLPTQELDRDAFLKLLVTQMQNQDPMNPTQNEDMIAQLAQFSSLEEMQGVNENLVALAVLQQGNALLEQMTGSSALIGKEITWIDAEGNEHSGLVGSVRVQDGEALLTVGGDDVPLMQVTGVGVESSDGDSGSGDTGSGDTDSGDTGADDSTEG